MAAIESNPAIIKAHPVKRALAIIRRGFSAYWHMGDEGKPSAHKAAKRELAKNRRELQIDKKGL